MYAVVNSIFVMLESRPSFFVVLDFHLSSRFIDHVDYKLLLLFKSHKGCNMLESSIIGLYNEDYTNILKLQCKMFQNCCFQNY